jgi:beta-glucosidase/6-phospho-beta-glucosidase/beta-galactosidase
MMFQSFFQGGFECSTHRRADGVRLDVIASTRHDAMAASDYALLQTLGISTVRDGARWHLIEKTPGIYDWSSFTPMLDAAIATRTQIIWDVLHYGWPDWLDIWSADFVERFAAFAKALALHVKDRTDEVPWYVPVNEISFLAWGGGQFKLFNPMARGRGHELKCQLVRASIAAIEAIWSVEPRARIAHTDPLIHVHHVKKGSVARAREQTHAQYQAWDMLSGRFHPELGGKPEYLDVIGVNYYCHNQWVLDGPPLDWRGTDARFIPFRDLLARTWKRYKRPMFIAETGIEAELRPEWFDYVCGEAFAAIELGAPIEGICLYPVMNHPGWDDDRHCPNGLIDYDRTTFRRWLEEPLAEAIRRRQGASDLVSRRA